ncbi:MAG: ABC transporter permease [Chloroflexi bacterium]|nr:ABC transporter permease [Chloroflexota bacterium]
MKIFDSLIMAVKALDTNKLRSALTVLGIIIGVGAVISVMSIGRGTAANVTSRIEGLGSNLLFVSPGATNQGGVRGAAGSAATLTVDDATALVDPVMAPAVVATAPEARAFGQMVAGGNNANSQIIGTTSDYQYIRNYPIGSGEFITDQNVASRSTVVVLGSGVAGTLFPGADPIDQVVRINNQQFRVQGVLEPGGGTDFFSRDQAVLMPITTMLYRFQAQRTARGGASVQSIDVQVVSSKQMENAKLQVADILRERHRVTGQDDFTITSQQDILGAAAETANIFTIFLGSIAGIALLVGGIGIMNIMLVSVTERTREIGIRKAVGAKRKDVMLQFTLEATILSLGGGIAGAGVGLGISRLIERLSLNGQKLQTLVTPDIIILAVSVSAAIGLLFGIYPALRASRLNPIEALRYE